MDNTSNNQRIAKNTLMLYVRMLFLMAVGLFTSRIILNALGVDDYGIYNVVGGFVSMFAVLSSSLSSAISRFITFEIGRNDLKRLKVIFATAINIQVVISLIIILVGETVGIWFLNNKMTIPADRLNAANWVLQFSIAAFVVNLISVPYNALIIAHEKMSAFAYISILEAILKLAVAYMLLVSPFDRLILYSCLLLIVSIIIRIIYGIYCKLRFEECSYHFVHDKSIIKEMSAFAGLSFFGNTAYLLNTQGVNLLMNVFFGVTVNAAKGIATQVDSAVRQFINSFMTAVDPQITKSYAAGDLEYMHKLILVSSKFSAYLMLIFAVPIVLETNNILALWLKTVPDYSVVFLRLTIFSTFCDSVFANSLVKAAMATGRIKRYQIIITICGFSVFPLSWLIFELGFEPQSAYWVYLAVYFTLIFVRLYLIKDLINLKPITYLNKVLFPFIPVFLISFIIPGIIHFTMEESLLRFLYVSLVSLPITFATVYFIGLTRNEKAFVTDKIFKKINSRL